MASITTRSSKGSELTHNEVDANFTNLNTDKIEEVSEDTTPQLGGDLDAQSNKITSLADPTAAQDAATKAYVDSQVSSGYTDSDVDTHLNTSTAGTNEVLSWTGSDYDWVAQSSGGGLSDVVDDTTPQLGGDLDVQTNKITSSGTQVAIAGTDDIDVIIGGDSSSNAAFFNQPDFKASADTGTGTNLVKNNAYTYNTDALNMATSIRPDDTTNSQAGYWYLRYHDGTNYNIGIKVTNDPEINFYNEYSFPTTDGTNGQVLTTDGAGQLSFTNASGVELTDFSVGAEGTPAGDGALSYNNTTGVFTYTPPSLSGLGGMADLVDDTTPTLGGNLDANAFNIVNIGQLDFDTTAAETASEGNVFWDADHETLAVGLSEGQLSLGMDVMLYGKALEAISKGDVVMFAGTVGDHLAFKKADASATGFIPQWVVGVADRDFSLNEWGHVFSNGLVEGIDTSTFSVGDLLYLDPDTAGGYVNTEPTAPDPKILVAAVTKVGSGTSGNIAVRLTLADSLSGLNDVHIASTPSDGDVLTWDNTNSRWNAEAPAGGGSTGNLTFTNYTITTDGDIESATTPKPRQIVFGDDTLAASAPAGKRGVFSFSESIEPDVTSHGEQRYYLQTNTIQVDQTVNNDTYTNNTRHSCMDNEIIFIGDHPQTNFNRNICNRNFVNLGKDSTTTQSVNMATSLHAGANVYPNNTDGNDNELSNFWGMVLETYSENSTGTYKGRIDQSVGLGFKFAHYQVDTGSEHINIYNADPSGSNPVKNDTSRFVNPSYYNIRNDDANSTEKLGCITQQTFRHRTISSSSGALTIDATRSPSLECSLTEDITSVTLSNFIAVTNNRSHHHEIRVLFINDGTGRSVTFPTSSNYYYKDNVNTISATANQRTWVTIVAVDDGSSGADYYIDIQPVEENLLANNQVLMTTDQAIAVGDVVHYDSATGKVGLVGEQTTLTGVGRIGTASNGSSFTDGDITGRVRIETSDIAVFTAGTGGSVKRNEIATDGTTVTTSGGSYQDINHSKTHAMRLSPTSDSKVVSIHVASGSSNYSPGRVIIRVDEISNSTNSYTSYQGKETLSANSAQNDEARAYIEPSSLYWIMYYQVAGSGGSSGWMRFGKVDDSTNTITKGGHYDAYTASTEFGNEANPGTYHPFIDSSNNPYMVYIDTTTFPSTYKVAKFTYNSSTLDITGYTTTDISSSLTGTGNILENGGVTSYSEVVEDPHNTDHFIVILNTPGSTSNTWNHSYFYLDCTGSTPTVETSGNWLTNQSYAMYSHASFRFDPADSTQAIVMYKEFDSSTTTSNEYVVRGLEIDRTSTFTVSNGNRASASFANGNSAGGNFMKSGTRAGIISSPIKDTSNNEYNYMWQYGGTISNLTSVDVLGIAQTATSADGEQAVIQLHNGISRVHSGLTIGTDYYVDGDGDIVTSSTGTKSVGTAVSSTEIAVGGTTGM